MNIKYDIRLSDAIGNGNNGAGKDREYLDSIERAVEAFKDDDFGFVDEEIAAENEETVRCRDGYLAGCYDTSQGYVYITGTVSQDSDGNICFKGEVNPEEGSHSYITMLCK